MTASFIFPADSLYIIILWSHFSSFHLKLLLSFKITVRSYIPLCIFLSFSCSLSFLTCFTKSQLWFYYTLLSCTCKFDQGCRKTHIQADWCPTKFYAQTSVGPACCLALDLHFPSLFLHPHFSLLA